MQRAEAVNHPTHYGGEHNPYEAIKVIEAWGLGFCLGNAVKYLSRAGKKDPDKLIEDLEKTAWYVNRQLESGKSDGCIFFRSVYNPFTVAREWDLSPTLGGVLIAIVCSFEKSSADKDLNEALRLLQKEISRLKGASL